MCDQLHTATHCNALQHTATQCNTLHHTTPHCLNPRSKKALNTCSSTIRQVIWLCPGTFVMDRVCVQAPSLPPSPPPSLPPSLPPSPPLFNPPQHTVLSREGGKSSRERGGCNSLQHTATHCNALQRTATH